MEKKEITEKNENNISNETLEKVLLGGDISSLKAEQKIAYYKSVCDSVGLNPLTKPFDFIRLQGKEVMYVKREATEQLRKINKVSINISGRELIGDAYIVTAKAYTKNREDESTGVVFIKGLVGEALANAYMKAETKAKRRVTLSICGLGLMDEIEIEDASPAEKKAERIQGLLEKEAEKIESATSQPVIERPVESTVKNAVPFDEFEDLPSEDPSKAEDLKASAYFTITVGKKFKDKKLIQFSSSDDKKELEKWARSSLDWFRKESKKMSPAWIETMDNVANYLGVEL